MEIPFVCVCKRERERERERENGSILILIDPIIDGNEMNGLYF